MKIFLKTIIGVLLVFNTAGALYGGGNLILHPDGSSIQLSLDWIKNTPFHNYLIPGIILFLVNGLFGVFVITIMIINHTRYSFWVVAQGFLLLAWIVIQIMLIQTVYFLHFIMAGVGFLLMLFGWISSQLSFKMKL